MKKIALVYSGQPRDIKNCFRNHVENLIKPNSDCEIDIFTHFWYDDSSCGKFFWEDYKDRGKWDSDVRFFILNSLKPKNIRLEKPRSFSLDEFIQPDPRFPHPINNILSMLYSIEQANNLKCQHEIKHNFKYDCVVRLRSDEFFLKSLGSLYNYDMQKLNVLDEWAHLDYGLNDHFAFGNSEIMNLYSSAYSNLGKILEMGCAINPECIVGFNAQVLNKLPVSKNNWEYKLWRDL
jgi:hypothetical protein